VRWSAAAAHRGTTPAGVFRLDLNGVDWAILISYFVVVLGIGFAAKRYGARGPVMLAWAFTKPLIPDEDEATGRGSGRLRKAS
jgi:hypothetical protein